jgi:hypothetical protein
MPRHSLKVPPENAPGGKFQRFEGALKEGQIQIGLFVSKKQAKNAFIIHVKESGVKSGGFRLASAGQ